MCRGARVPKLAEGTLGGPVVLPLGCEFLGVAAASPTDVWAVGARIVREHDSHGRDATVSLVEHWDGRGWRVVSTPNVGGLDAVVAVDRGDVWAASNGQLAAGFGRGAFLRWNGTAWRRVPAAAEPGASFSALAAAGTNDVWAIGSTGAGRGVVEHWTGRRWRIVLIPPLTQLIAKRDIELTGIVARRHGDVWVAGIISPYPKSGRRDFTRALVLHWDGHSWRRVPGPHPGRYIDSIASAGIDASGRIWLGGDFETDRPNGHITASGALLAVREGGRWVMHRLPGSHRNAYTPVSIAGAAQTDVWAVGSGNWASGRFVAHWNGTAWTLAPLPSPRQPITPYAITTPTASDAWLVGATFQPPARVLPAALHWNGHAWAGSAVVK